MISPKIHIHELVPPPPGEIQEDKRNGYGYWVFLPTPAAPLNETLSVIGEYGDFSETPEVVHALQETGAVLLNGAPGSGKSHLIRDIQTACVLNNVPVFGLTMHINGGSRQGVENITPQLDDFRDKTRETGGGLVILDNVDFVGYKGKRASKRNLKRDYAQAALPMVQNLIDDPNLVVLGTGHDESWREGRWTWEDDEIDRPAHAILEAFPTHMEFEGKMALEGLAHILWSRNNASTDGLSTVSKGEAAQVMSMLDRSSRANFFHANHLPVQLFLTDPEAAIAQIEAGRTERRGHV